MERLTPRQCEYLRLRCLGKTGAQIAACLSVSPSTVKVTLTRVYERLGVHGGSRDAWACYLLGLADAHRVLPQSSVGAMRAVEV